MPVIRNGNVNSYSESDQSQIRGSRRISRKMDLLDQKMDNMYKGIYVSRPDNRTNMANIINKFDDAIDSVQGSEMTVSGMSELLRRVQGNNGRSSNVSDLMNSVGELFNDQSLLNSLFANDDVHKYISGQNFQYDLICKYLPKLLDALEIKRDNVLSSDNFSKNFVNPLSNRTSKSEMQKFSSNVDRLEKEYEIQKFYEKLYMDTSKYGEQFVYVVPYNIALERIIKRTNYRKNSARLGQVSFYESAGSSRTNRSEVCLESNYGQSRDFLEYKSEIIESYKSQNLPAPVFDKNFSGDAIRIHFNDSNVISSAINERVVINERMDHDRFKSLNSIFESTLASSLGNTMVELQEKIDDTLQKQFEKIKLDNDGISAANSNDGLIIPGNLDRDPNKIDKNMLGAVVEVLPRENVIPIYIGKVCMGYYYIEFAEEKGLCGYCGSSHMTPGVTNANNFAYENQEDQQELAIRFIANKISASIDTHFINANKDLKEEIYAILRYNEKFDISRSNDIGVTFIPADDIVHCYFEFDEKTHRGISDLQKSLVPAMLYILLYLTDIIGKITRSADKRIYYVKQNVETNVARTMMNVVQQIKKGNMGMRQIESMNNILNIVGKYNDYIIPLGQSGDPPITFEVMQGQDINTPTDIMEKMEEMAVNGTGVPFEMLNSIYQQDFAIRFSMSNSRFLKHVYNRQRDAESFFSKIYTKIYNYEFDQNNSKIKVELPPPLQLSISNNQQLFDNVTQQADKIIETHLSDEPDEVKVEFKKIYTRNCLSTYINFNDVERYITAAKVNIEAKKQPAVDDSGSNDSDMMDDF